MPRGKRKTAKNAPGKEVKKMAAEAKCGPEQAFVAVDGSNFSSIGELAHAVDVMSDDTFYYHVTDFKNDFHNWVKDVFNEEKLAEDMLKARTRERHLIVLLKYLLEHR